MIFQGNVLVAETGRAVVADFGVSFIGMTNVGTTTSADFAGSVNWMAPELLTVDRPEPTKESDMWSFGCTCYEVSCILPVDPKCFTHFGLLASRSSPERFHLSNIK
jgi:serine/threonine protein kinase